MQSLPSSAIRVLEEIVSFFTETNNMAIYCSHSLRVSWYEKVGKQGYIKSPSIILVDMPDHRVLRRSKLVSSGKKRIKPSTSASGSQPSGNTKKDKIRQTPSSTPKNKHSKRNSNSELKCVKCNGCMLSDKHDLCVLDFINNVNARKESKSVNKSSKSKVWKPTGKVFSNIGYIWRPIGRTFTKVPLRKPPALENATP
ncbi:hypothetical protein Tco_1289093 [Tanacetum coccineum]